MRDPEVVVVECDGVVEVTATSYRWRWTAADDGFELLDAQGRRIVGGPLRPAVVTSVGGGHRPSVTGPASSWALVGDALTVGYDPAGDAPGTTLTWVFEAEACWLRPVVCHLPAGTDLVSLTWFAESGGVSPDPGLRCDWTVQPGVTESSAVGPVIPAKVALAMTTWLGRGALDAAGTVAQQWGLPAHWFGGVTVDGFMNARSGMTRHLSDAFCCGAAGLCTGDLLLEQRGGAVSPVLRLREDLWGSGRTRAADVETGPPWLFVTGRDYRQAAAAYVTTLRETGTVRVRERSARALRRLSAPTFNTWGAQMAGDTMAGDFDEAALTQVYDDLRESGLRAEQFVVDDRWEGAYGLLEHDSERFPGFEAFLDRVRADGLEIGLWAAFLRCTDPALLGLGEEDMLQGHDGRPLTRGHLGSRYQLFDVSRPDVQDVLRDRARAFVRRYRPALVKFDFGYELPSLADTAPWDRTWSGEVMLHKALDVVVGAMREVDPDIVVMYYNLSPLFTEHIDLHSTDDLWLAQEEFHLEANRRLFFSSLLGAVGVSSYGSGGYDWERVDDIWFDSVALGPLGCLGSFRGDSTDSVLTPAAVARFNGLAQVRRPGRAHVVDVLEPHLLGGSSGGRSPSWVRTEDGARVVVALRPVRWDGRPGSGRCGTLLTSTAAVVVASTSEADIASARSLVVVPCGRGRASLQLDAPGAVRAGVTVHAAGRVPSEHEVPVVGGRLDLDLEVEVDGHPVEWLDVRVG